MGYNDDEAPYDFISGGYYCGNTAGPDITFYFDRIIFGGPGHPLESMMYDYP